MTKVEKLINEFYAIEDLTLSENLFEMQKEMDVHEFATELVDLLHMLNENVD